MLFDDDVVLLAGATGSVGGATLHVLVAEGARVVLISRARANAERAVESLVPTAQRSRVAIIEADLRDAASAQHAVDAAVERHGRLDAVVSLAGGSVFLPLVDSTVVDLEENLALNLVANYNLFLPALRSMLAQPMADGAASRGRMVAVSAGSSKDPQPRFGLFGASKAGLNVLMQAIAREHKADGIVANAVVLGGVATERARDYLSPDDFAAAAAPDEVARVLAFLASAGTSGINGALVDLNAREVD
ncbi:MAG: SDR family NAD(P)-dependent oxidoreductase [Vulcanimicrobiaceae bacterium]